MTTVAFDCFSAKYMSSRLTRSVSEALQRALLPTVE